MDDIGYVSKRECLAALTKLVEADKDVEGKTCKELIEMIKGTTKECKSGYGSDRVHFKMDGCDQFSARVVHCRDGLRESDYRDETPIKEHLTRLFNEDPGFIDEISVTSNDYKNLQQCGITWKETSQETSKMPGFATISVKDMAKRISQGKLRVEGVATRSIEG